MHSGTSWRILASSHRRLQLLDLPVPQMVENVTDTLLRILDFPIAEQVIDVPNIFCSPCPLRSRVPEPQLADQLVEVPTVLTPTRIALQIAERIVDTPVSRGQVKTAKKELRERRQDMLDELVVLRENFLPSERTPSVERRIAQLLSALHASSKPPKRKRKKRRKKRLPRSPRPLFRVRAHRRLQQWLVPGWFFCAALGQGWHARCGPMTGAWFDGSVNCGAPALPVHRWSSISSSFRSVSFSWSRLLSRPQRFFCCRSCSSARFPCCAGRAVPQVVLLRVQRNTWFVSGYIFLRQFTEIFTFFFLKNVDFGS